MCIYVYIYMTCGKRSRTSEAAVSANPHCCVYSDSISKASWACTVQNPLQDSKPEDEYFGNHIHDLQPALASSKKNLQHKNTAPSTWSRTSPNLNRKPKLKLRPVRSTSAFSVHRTPFFRATSGPPSASRACRPFGYPGHLREGTRSKSSS